MYDTLLPPSTLLATSGVVLGVTFAGIHRLLVQYVDRSEIANALGNLFTFGLFAGLLVFAPATSLAYAVAYLVSFLGVLGYAHSRVRA